MTVVERNVTICACADAPCSCPLVAKSVNAGADDYTGNLQCLLCEGRRFSTDGPTATWRWIVACRSILVSVPRARWPKSCRHSCSPLPIATPLTVASKRSDYDFNMLSAYVVRAR